MPFAESSIPDVDMFQPSRRLTAVRAKTLLSRGSYRYKNSPIDPEDHEIFSNIEVPRVRLRYGYALRLVKKSGERTLYVFAFNVDAGRDDGM
jgi:hypothetical protein